MIWSEAVFGDKGFMHRGAVGRKREYEIQYIRNCARKMQVDYQIVEEC